jgi:uncharacterized protein YecT (DUF1311 family)
MKFCLTIAVLAFLCATADAQKHTPSKDCLNTAQTQTGLDACAGSKAKQADDEMNRVYRQLLAKIASQPRAKAKIIASQRAWLVYRDSYMEAMYPEEDKQAAYGTIYPMEASLLLAQLTTQQTKALRNLLKNYEDPGCTLSGMCDDNH